MATRDPAAASPAQLRALACAASRELSWGLWSVRAEHRRWTRRAAEIPDAAARAAAGAALQDKRPLLDGVAVFAASLVPDRVAARRMVRALVAFQILANHQDHDSERAAAGLPVCGPGMASFTEVVDLSRAPDRYRAAAACHDGGYLAELVSACRGTWDRLPNYGANRDLLVAEVRRARSLDVEHVAWAGGDPDLLRRFAATTATPRQGMTWFETTAGSSSMLTAICALALTACTDRTSADVAAAIEAYSLVASVSTLLDNYIDLPEDDETGAHNYLRYYPSTGHAVDRIVELAGDAVRAVGTLRDANRHRVIVCSMLAMFVTTDGARAQDPREVARMVHAGGSLTRLLVPVLAAWRLGARQRGA